MCLPGNNDGHILPAVYLNAIDEVYVLLKQRGAKPGSHNRVHEDRGGRPHHIRYYADVEEMADEIGTAAPCDIVLDIDLDFFTESPDDEFASIRIVPDGTIEEILRPDGPLMSVLLPRLTGITLALEPRYCGGLSNSLRILSVIDTLLFDPGLFHDNCKWRHVGALE